MASAGADHPYRLALTAPADPSRRPPPRRYGHLRCGPHLPLTTSLCEANSTSACAPCRGISNVHLGISPMPISAVHYSAPTRSSARRVLVPTVASIAHRWGFTHPSQLRPAHKKIYGNTAATCARALLRTPWEGGLRPPPPPPTAKRKLITLKRHLEPRDVPSPIATGQ